MWLDWLFPIVIFLSTCFGLMCHCFNNWRNKAEEKMFRIDDNMAKMQALAEYTDEQRRQLQSWCAYSDKGKPLGPDHPPQPTVDEKLAKTLINAQQAIWDGYALVNPLRLQIMQEFIDEPAKEEDLPGLDVAMADLKAHNQAQEELPEAQLAAARDYAKELEAQVADLLAAALVNEEVLKYMENGDAANKQIRYLVEDRALLQEGFNSIEKQNASLKDDNEHYQRQIQQLQESTYRLENVADKLSKALREKMSQ